MTGIEDLLSAQSGWKLYPNPANSTLSIQFDKGLFHGEVLLMDVLGKVALHQKAVAGNITLDVYDLPAGIYSLVAKSEDAIYRSKVVVVH